MKSLRRSLIVVAALGMATAFAPAAHAGPLGDAVDTVSDTLFPVLDQVPQDVACQEQTVPLPEPAPSGSQIHVQVGYCKG